MRDRITIEELEVFYRVGVPDSERSRPQRLLISVRMHLDFTSAAAKDDLAGTIDYAAVARWLLGFGQDRQWRLIETLAVEIAQTLLGRFKAGRVEVEIRKFILPEARHVSVRVERGGT